MAGDAPVRGYLAPAARPDLTKVLAAPPQPGSPRALADAAIFDQSRALKDTPRWALATDDVNGSFYHHYAQALGVTLTPEQAPILTALLSAQAPTARWWVWRKITGARSGLMWVRIRLRCAK